MSKNYAAHYACWVPATINTKFDRLGKKIKILKVTSEEKMSLLNLAPVHALVDACMSNFICNNNYQIFRDFFHNRHTIIGQDINPPIVIVKVEDVDELKD